MATIKKKRYNYRSLKAKSAYFFCFLSKKNKKREYAVYQKCYEKFYGQPCEVSYKKFWIMMFWKSIDNCLRWIYCPFLILLEIMGPGTLLVLEERQNRKLLYHDEMVAINDELQKQWDKEDRLEALKKESKRKKI